MRQCNKPADADSLTEWLITLGYPDHTAARTAAQHLAAPHLWPLWQLLQTRLLSAADQAKLDRALKQSSKRVADPNREQLQLKHKQLALQIADCKREISKQQVRTPTVMLWCCMWADQCTHKSGVCRFTCNTGEAQLCRDQDIGGQSLQHSRTSAYRCQAALALDMLEQLTCKCDKRHGQVAGFSFRSVCKYI